MVQGRLSLWWVSSTMRNLKGRMKCIFSCLVTINYMQFNCYCSFGLIIKVLNVIEAGWALCLCLATTGSYYHLVWLTKATVNLTRCTLLCLSSEQLLVVQCLIWCLSSTLLKCCLCNLNSVAISENKIIIR